MSLILQLLRLTDEYERATGAERKTVSWRVFGDSKKLNALKAEGADIQVKRAEAAIEWLHENWPPEAEWPEDVPRPASAGPNGANDDAGGRGAAA